MLVEKIKDSENGISLYHYFFIPISNNDSNPFGYINKAMAKLLYVSSQRQAKEHK